MNLVSNQDLVLHVKEGPESPLIQYCDLYLNDTNVKSILEKEFPDACQLKYMDYKPFAVGKRELVTVSYVDSVKNFYIQVCKDGDKLKQTMKQISEIGKTAQMIDSSNIKATMPCLAIYSQDNEWYANKCL